MTNRDSAVEDLIAALAAEQAIKGTVSRAVRRARADGVGWQEIAELAGISKPTAISRWKEEVPMSLNTSTGFDMQPGDRIRRADLHDRWGGNRQAGISTPKHGEDIFLFTGGGEAFGYEDQDLGNGLFQYNGEGLRRNHEMDRGNRAILRHAETGRHLRLFRKCGAGFVEYVGEYVYRSDRIEGRRDPMGGQLHEHIVFVLERV